MQNRNAFNQEKSTIAVLQNDELTADRMKKEFVKIATEVYSNNKSFRKLSILTNIPWSVISSGSFLNLQRVRCETSCKVWSNRWWKRRRIWCMAMASVSSGIRWKWPIYPELLRRSIDHGELRFDCCSLESGVKMTKFTIFCKCNSFKMNFFLGPMHL